MIDSNSVIHNLKKFSFDEAYAVLIPILNKENITIGYLVPVGNWILKDQEKIILISLWRRRAMKMFLTQFESTYERTYEYLNNFSVKEPNRIFFLLYDINERFVGHIGLAGIDGQTGELDNIMRGLEGGVPRLIFYAELTLLDWCFKVLGISSSYLRVLSYNWLAISLHQEVGFLVHEQIPLYKVIHNGFVLHQPCLKTDTNVRYNCTKMLLSNQDFYRKNKWLDG